MSRRGGPGGLQQLLPTSATWISPVVLSLLPLRAPEITYERLWAHQRVFFFSEGLPRAQALIPPLPQTGPGLQNLAETHFLAWGPRGRASSETGEAKWSGSPSEARSLTAASLHHLQQQGSSGQCAPRAGAWAHPNTPFPPRRGAPSPRQAANQLSGLGEPRCISQPALLLLRGNFPAIPSICAATSHPLPSHSKLPSSSSPWVRLCGSDPTAAHTHLLLPHFLFSGEWIMCWCKSSSAWLRSLSRRGAELSGQRRRDLPC